MTSQPSVVVLERKQSGITRPGGKLDWVVAASSLFVLLFCVYALSYNGTFTSDDEQHLVAGAQTFAVTGRLMAMQLYGNPRLQGGFHEVDPGLSVIGAMIYGLVEPTHLGSVQALYLINPFVTALTAVCVLLTGRIWGYNIRLATWAALTFGVASMAWPYAKTFFRDPLAALFVAAAWLCFEYALTETHSVWLRWARWCVLVILVAGGVLAKNIIMLLVPVVVVVSIVRTWMSSKQRKSTFAGTIMFAVVCAAFLIRPPESNLFRSSREYFVWLWQWLTVIPHSGFWPAFWGALVSPGKGLMVYAPYTALAALSWLADWKLSWQRLLGPSLWALAMVAAQAYFYDYRWTNSQWGARFLLPALPGLAAITLPAADWLMRRWPRGGWSVLAGVSSIGLFTQLPGALIAPPDFSALLLKRDPESFFGPAIWSLDASAVAGHWRLLLTGHPWALAICRTFEQNPLAVVTLVVGIAIMMGVAGLLLRQTIRAGGTAYQLGTALFLAFLTVAVLPPGLLKAYQNDPAHCIVDSPATQVTEFLNSHATGHDLIVVRGYLDPFWYCYFNFGRPSNTWVGLPTYDSLANDTLPGDPFYLPGIDADSADKALFESAALSYERLWYVSDGNMPTGMEGMDVAAWLRNRFSVEDEWSITNETEFRLIRFQLR